MTNMNAWHVVGSMGPAIQVAAMMSTAGLIVLMNPLFRRFAVAVPTCRSSHLQATPQGGGLAVIVAALGLSALCVFFSSKFTAASFGFVLAATLLLMIVGTIDDIRGLGIVQRLIAQMVAVAMVIGTLPTDAPVIPALPIWIDRAFLFVGGLWFVNLVNFMDGIDWMMVAEVVPITAGVALIGALGALPPDALVIALALNGAMLGFAPFNRPIARLFLGDAGSLPTGLLIGWLLLLVAGTGYLAAALLLPLYFVVDATITLLLRVRAHERIWEAHRRHFYQQAIDRGFSAMAVVARVFAVNVALVLLAAATVVVPTFLASVAAVGLGIALVAWLILTFARGSR